MRAIGLKTLKNKLSAFLRDAMLADAVRQGWVTPPALVAAGAPPRKPVMKFHDLMAELDQDRNDR